MSVIIVTPRTTEKAYELSTQGIYVFDVPLGVNRNQIKDAIEEQFEVTVVKVKTLVQAGKAIRFSRGKNRYPGSTHRKDSKKAYVTLKDGDSIQVFEESTKKETK